MTTIKTAVEAQFAGRTPAQQIALDAARLAKKAKHENDDIPLIAPTVAPAPVSAPAAASAPETLRDKVEQAMAALSELFGDVAPEANDSTTSWKRRVAALFATIAVAAPVGYAIGTLAGYAMVGAFTLTGSIFLVYLVWITAMILSMYAGFKIGQYVGNYVLSGQIDRDVMRAKNAIVGLFNRKPTVVIS